MKAFFFYFWGHSWRSNLHFSKYLKSIYGKKNTILYPFFRLISEIYRNRIISSSKKSSKNIKCRYFQIIISQFKGIHYFIHHFFRLDLNKTDTDTGIWNYNQRIAFKNYFYIWNKLLCERSRPSFLCPFNFCFYSIQYLTPTILNSSNIHWNFCKKFWNWTLLCIEYFLSMMKFWPSCIMV